MKFTQQMTMHLNGGSKFTQLNYAIFADGKPTNLTRTTRTGGSPQYLKTMDCIGDGNEVFDVLSARGVGVEDWVNAHVKIKEEAKDAE